MNRLSLGALACLTTFLSTLTSATAAGTVDIVHPDGTSVRYRGTSVTIVGTTLRLRSPDRKGTLAIERAACSHQGSILMCLPTQVAVRQQGTSRLLPLATGTIYFNLTDAAQTMRYSSRQLPPHGILLSLRTERGTLINLDGAIDAKTAR